MHLKIEKGWKRLLFYAGILGTLTGGFTIAGGIKWIHREVHSHEELDSLYAYTEELELEIVLFKKAISDLVKADEFFFHFARNMTDDNDKTIYWVDEGRGTNDEIHEVDRRENNEEHQFGFVYDKWWVMDLNIDDADDTRMTLLWKDGSDRRIVPD